MNLLRSFKVSHPTFLLKLWAEIRIILWEATNRRLHSNSILTCKSNPCVCKCDGDAEKNNFEQMNHVVVEGISLVLRESNLWLISATPCIDYWFPARLMSSLDVVYESLHCRFDIVPFSLSTRLHLHILCNRNQRPAPNLWSRLLAVARSNWEIGGKAPKEKLKNCFLKCQRHAMEFLKNIFFFTAHFIFLESHNAPCLAGCNHFWKFCVLTAMSSV